MNQIFDPLRIKPRQIQQDGRRALEKNLYDYKDTTKPTNTRFTIAAVNDYNQRRDRLDTLKSNEELGKQNEAKLREAERSLRELKQLDEVKELTAELQKAPDIQRAVYRQLDVLLAGSGHATQIKAYINREAAYEDEARREKLDKVQHILDELDLPQKQQELTTAKSRIDDLTTIVTNLHIELSTSRTDNTELTTELNNVRIELNQRANESITDVADLKAKIQLRENEKSNLEDKVKGLVKDIEAKNTLIASLQNSLTDKDETIKAKDRLIETARKQYDDQANSHVELSEKYSSLFNEKREDTLASTYIDKLYEAEKHAKQSLQLHYDQSVKRCKELEAALNKAGNLENEIQKLRAEKNALSNQINTQTTTLKTNESEILGLKSNLSRAREETTRVEKSKLDLEKQFEKEREQARLEAASLKQARDLDDARTTTEMKNLSKNYEETKKAGIKERSSLQAEIRDHKTSLALVQIDLDNASAEKRRIQENLQAEQARAKEAERKEAEAASRNIDNDTEIRRLNEMIDRYEKGIPDAEEDLRAARHDTDMMKEKADLVRKEKEQVEEQLHQYNELITKYAFGAKTTITLDYHNAAKALKKASSVTQSDIRRATEGLRPFLVGLPEHRPLTGFELWVEAKIRPEEFTTMKLIAFLTNAQASKEIGFLWLVIDALLEVPDGSTKGFLALAIMDTFQALMHIDPSQKEEVEKRWKSYSSSRTTSTLDTQATFDAFLTAVHGYVELIINPDQSIPNRGEQMRNKILYYDNLRQNSINMSETVEHQIVEFRFLLALTSEPRYLIYVENGRIAWLRPEDITIQIHTAEYAVSIHDKLPHHLFPVKKVSFFSVDPEDLCTLLDGATYVD